MENRGKMVYWSIITIIGVVGYLLHEYNGLDDSTFQFIFCILYFLISLVIYLAISGRSINVLAPIITVGRGLSTVSQKIGESGISWLDKQELSDYEPKFKFPKYDFKKKEWISPRGEIRKKIDPHKKLGPVKVQETFIGADSSEVYAGIRAVIGNVEADVAASTKDIVRIDNIKKTKRKKR